MSKRHAAPEPTGVPLSLPLDLIDEDPDQPRTADNPGFSPESIAGLGATIKARGVKSPISVRENPKAPGRFLINHGARRFRASKWAGKTTIPAFVDMDYSNDDQAIENLQRDALTPREIAEFISKKVRSGMKRVAIAAAIGKSGSYVTKHLALLNLPEPIAAAFNAGDLNDINLIYDLSTVYRHAPEDVTNWLQYHNANLNYVSFRALRKEIETRNAQPKGDEEEPTDVAADSSNDASPGINYAQRAALIPGIHAGSATLLAREPHRPQEALPEKRPRSAPVIRVALRSDPRQEGELLLVKEPSAAGRVWLKTHAGEVDAVGTDVFFWSYALLSSMIASPEGVSSFCSVNGTAGRSCS